VARVLALVPDLLFGSRLLSALTAAGHDVTLEADPLAARASLAAADPPQVVLVDLTDAALDGPGLIAAWGQEGLLAATRTAGFYAHVDADARERAERAGFDLVVPRSRMAREAARLVGRLGAAAGEP
jgi:CheY-like chemotaxis protein